MSATWDKKFIDLTLHVSTWSKDRGTQVGAVIVGEGNRIVSMGYNGFCRGIDDTKPERHEKPAKYYWTEHSEKNCIYNAAYNGVSTKGCVIYTSLFPCVDCARGIINSGIVEVIIKDKPDYNHARYGEEFKISLEMFNEADVKVRYYNE
jgi:dCMP deaminase